MAERRVARVVAEADRLDEILVQAQRTGDAARDRRRLERVRHPRAVVVAGRIDEHLRLALEPAERFRVEDAVAVALERGPHPTLLFVAEPAAVLVGAHGERRQPPFLVLADARLEGVGDSPCELGHAADLVIPAATAKTIWGETIARACAAVIRVSSSSDSRGRARQVTLGNLIWPTSADDASSRLAVSIGERAHCCRAP